MYSASNASRSRIIGVPLGKNIRQDEADGEEFQNTQATLALASMRHAMASVREERVAVEPDAEEVGPGHISRAHEAVRPEGMDNYVFFLTQSDMGRGMLAGRVPTEAVDQLAVDMGPTTRPIDAV